jgi:valyl-tRNA synthetase
MEKVFSPDQIEAALYQHWESQGYFHPSKPDAEPYCIMIPPPNVTGSLHMGHAFQATLMDTLIRWQRMQGKNTLWQVGTDHAGIATQMVVEGRLATQQQTRQTLGREAFIEKIWQWKAQSGGTITQQLRRMGASVDWQRERFTMDEGLSAAVTEVFVRLHQEGLIYRGKRLVNWDPKLETAISDLEVLPTETDGHLWHLRYPLASGKGFIVVATTRPETLLGDTAVAVHPDDARYQTLIGQQLQLPLTSRLIPIIADDTVDPSFGSGCVKITPGHDFNDFAMGQRHQLPVINIFTRTATLNDQVPAAYQGLDRFVARQKIITDLTDLGLLEKIEAHTLKLPMGDRSGVVIEPYLTEQWYVKVGPLAEPAIHAVENGTIEFVPKGWENTYFAWMRNIQDWCISRQLWWGHRIPAWYDDTGKIYVGRTEAEIRQTHQLADSFLLRQDEDVLDTWFSSALWTFSTLGWPSQTPDLKSFHPTSVLVTGFDIIFFWVARMIMMTLKFTQQIPFQKVYVHGLVRDGEGQKMSKSKGNVLDPIDVIDGITLDALIHKRTQGLMQPHLAEKITQQTRKQFADGIAAYGTDALRFTFLSLASTGRDIRFDMSRLEGYRNFCNKLWNATRFVLMHIEGHELQPATHSTLSVIDQWIRGRCEHAAAQIQQHLHDYRFDLAAQQLYDVIWEQFCDWYLEFAKVSLLSGDSIQQNNTRYQLASCLEYLLRLAHPMLPFITETLWQQLRQPLKLSGDSIMLADYPSAARANESVENHYDVAANDILIKIDWLKQVIIAIRTLRSELNVAPGKKITLLLQSSQAKDHAWIEQFSAHIKSLARIECIDWLESSQPTPMAAAQWIDQLHIMVPMAGLIDVAVERARLQKQLLDAEQWVTRLQQKLANRQFVDNAPTEVVQRERQKLSEHQTLCSQLQSQLQQLHFLQ